MPIYKQDETRQMRIRDVPVEIHRRIVAHQKLLSLKQNADVSIDEAAVDLWRQATDKIPALSKP